MTIVLVIFVTSVTVMAVVELFNIHRSPCDRAGHRWSLQVTSSRIYLSCDMCDQETPGWQLFGIRTEAGE